MKKVFLLKSMLLLCALIVGSSSVWAEDTESVTFSNEYNDKDKPTSYTGTDFSIAFSKGDGSNNPQYYASGTGVRLYIKNTMTISSSTKKIKSIALTYKMNGSSSTYPTGVSASTGTANISTTSSSTSGSWTAADETTASVTFTVNGSKGNIQVQTITVTFVEADPDAPSATLSPTSLDFGEVEVGETIQKTFTVTPANLTGNLTIASNNAKYTVSPTSIAQATTTETTITVTAAPTAWNDDMNGTITISGGGLTPSKTVTLTATPYQEANVTLVAEGNLGTFEKDGVAITGLTSRVGSKAKIKAKANSGYEFTSWSAVGANPASSSDAETEFTFTSSEVTLTANFGVKLSSDFVKVTNANTLRAGDQLILVYEEGNLALGAINSGGKYYESASVTINDDVISDPTGVAVLTLGGEEDAWTLKSSLSNQYLSLPNNSNELRAAASVGNEEAEEWTISISDGNVYIINNKNPQNDNKNRYIQWNSGSPRFACYTGTQKNIQLYRLSKSVTITSAEYATYCGNKALNFDGVGIKAFTATDGETSVKLNEFTSGKVPANTPVVLYKEGLSTTTTFDVPVAASADAFEGTNDLHVSDGTTAVGNGIYVLANKTNGVGFYPWTSTTSLSAGKIYLKSESTTPAPFLGFDSEGTTGIVNVNRETITNNQYYTLDGRRVAEPTKGLYIINGKKVVIK